MQTTPAYWERTTVSVSPQPTSAAASFPRNGRCPTIIKSPADCSISICTPPMGSSRIQAAFFDDPVAGRDGLGKDLGRLPRAGLFAVPGRVGSRSVWQFVGARRRDLVVCSHIDAARGVERIGSSTVFNCGPAFRGCYALASLLAEGQTEVEVELRTA